MTEPGTMIEVRNLVKHYKIRRGLASTLLRRDPGLVHALDGVSFSLGHNETLAVVGESGSGKTTLGLAVLGLIELTSGQLLFEGTPISGIPENKLKSFRRQMQVVFQDPSSSLDPRKKIVDSLVEPLQAYKEGTKSGRKDRASAVMTAVGLEESQLSLYPRHFSGGQRQRICIARALIQSPKFLVLDEPTSSLDVSVQSQILLLLQKLQTDFGLTYLLITHNMIVARYLSDRIAVMYLGQIVELGRNEDVTNRPMHPYTQQLSASVLQPGVFTDITKIQMSGEPPSAVNPPGGCRFNTRCPYAEERCRAEAPELRSVEEGHFVACHFAEEINSKVSGPGKSVDAP